MKLELRNVGIIAKADILLDGLTVLTGKNGTGKTSIGKVLYGVVQGANGIEESFALSRKEYIQTSLLKEVMRLRRLYFPERITNDASSELRRKRRNLVDLLNLGISDIEYDVDLLERTCQLYREMDYKTFVDYCGLDNSKDWHDFYDIVSNDLVMACENCLRVLNQPDSMENFIASRIKSFLEYGFSGQIKPMDSLLDNTSIVCTNNDALVYGASMKDDHAYETNYKSTFNIPFSRAVFIDDPYVLDRFQNGKTAKDENEADARRNLCEILDGNDQDNYFSSTEREQKLAKLYEKINSIVPGEFEVTTKNAFYVSQNKKLKVGNLATGSKQFLILKTLLAKGYLDDRTLLILDEPETHLHPEWINRFAEILVLLIKEAGLHVVLATHSPNMLIALENYANEYYLMDHSHFYLGELEKDGVLFSCIDGKVNEGYVHLSVPLIEMSVAKKKYNR